MHIYLYTYLNMPVLSSRAPASPLHECIPNASTDCEKSVIAKFLATVVSASLENPAFCRTSIRDS